MNPETEDRTALIERAVADVYEGDPIFLIAAMCQSGPLAAVVQRIVRGVHLDLWDINCRPLDIAVAETMTEMVIAEFGGANKRARAEQAQEDIAAANRALLDELAKPVKPGRDLAPWWVFALAATAIAVVYFYRFVEIGSP